MRAMNKNLPSQTQTQFIFLFRTNFMTLFVACMRTLHTTTFATIARKSPLNKTRLNDIKCHHITPQRKMLFPQTSLSHLRMYIAVPRST